MPRIAVAIGVFLLIAFFTFVNIRTYPTVWEMVGASPWFTRQAQSSPAAVSPHAQQVADRQSEKTLLPGPELKSLAGSKTLSSLDPATPNGLEPRPQYPSAMSPGYLAEGATKDMPLNQSPTAGSPAYQGLNVGPIMVSPPSPQTVAAGNVPREKPYGFPAATNAAADLPAPAAATWPAEMSPQMKYAAKPSLLENSRHCNPPRPLVPVDLPQKNQRPAAAAKDQQESPHAAAPAAKDSTTALPPPQNAADEDLDSAVVRRLPPVDPSDRPILMTISPDGPIPIYPSTGR